MKYWFILLLLAISGGQIHAQAPYIQDDTGLGQYGYLEVDATTTTTLNSNTYSVRGLAARWWTGAEYIYYPSNNPGCAQQSFFINDYSSSNHANWTAGTIAYVSVRFRGCDNVWNGTNFNERQFKLVNVTDYSSYGGPFDNSITDNPAAGDNLVGTFTLNAGSAVTLDRLWIFNQGTAQETTDIPGSGISIYYESITGAEQFGGSESFVNLGGGASATDEVWGSDNLNIPVPSAGIRCYIVVNDIASTMTPNNTVQFQIINDGISFEELLNSKNLLRVNVTSTAPSAAPLPVQLIDFNGLYRNEEIQLQWQTADEQQHSHFEVAHSTNAQNWTVLGTVNASTGTSSAIKSYQFTHANPADGNNFYRLKQVDTDGQFAYSNIVRVKASRFTSVEVGPNPVRNGQLNLYFKQHDEQPVDLKIYDLTGRLIRSVQLGVLDREQIGLDVSDLTPGTYLLRINDLPATEVIIR